MLEIFIIVFTAIVVFPFITYCIVVFIEHYRDIYYMKDYVLYLKTHYQQELFLFPLINTFISIAYLITGIVFVVLTVCERIIKRIPSNKFMRKCSTKWDKFTEWFMNIKIK